MERRQREEISKWVATVLLVIVIYRFILRQSLIGVIETNLPAREAGLLAGMVLGQKGFLEGNFYENLKNSGLVHLVVASGSNVMLLSKILIENLAWVLGRKKAIIGGMVVLWGYGGMVGWEAPIARAVIMISIYYWAQLLGRKYNVWRGLLAAGAVMVIADKKMVEGVSFWLSMAAFVGVVSREKGDNGGMWEQLKESFREGWWIGLWTTPIIALVFGRISLVAPWSNMLVVWMVGWVSVVGWAGVVLGQIAPIMGRALWLGYPALKFLGTVTEGLGGIKWAAWEVKFNWMMAAGWYLIMIYKVIKRQRLNGSWKAANSQPLSNR
jgi:competence protein ComEC